MAASIEAVAFDFGGVMVSFQGPKSFGQAGATLGLEAEELRIDFLGLNAIHGAMTPSDAREPYEVAVRVAARTKTREEANKIGREVDGMAVSGVGMTGKRVPHQDRTREIIGVWSSLVPREKIVPEITVFES